MFIVSALLTPRVLKMPIVFLLSLMLYEYNETICKIESNDIIPTPMIKIIARESTLYDSE